MGKKPMSQREIAQEISDVTQLKREIVESVLAAYTDIFIREVVMHGRFRHPNCYSVKPYIRKARRQYNVHKGEYFDYPETEMLSITLSKKVRNFHRWKQRSEYNEKHGLTLEDWQNRKGPELPNEE